MESPAPLSPIESRAMADENGFQIWTETERSLQVDAPWKKIQENTFTNWVNNKLSVINVSIESLETDFSDGIRLIQLVQVLSGKKIGRYNKTPNFRSQRFENVSQALDFLTQKENIKLVNIGSIDIVDCNLKLILGLIWILILHYDIATAHWEDDSFNASAAGDGVVNKKAAEKKKAGVKETPKERLLTWVTVKLPPTVRVKNFSTDWNSGVALGALVDSCAPGLNPDWPDWDPNNKLQNAQEAMDKAEKWLNVPQLIRPSEVIDPNLDEQSMMTYLSQYPTAKALPDTPVYQRTPKYTAITPDKKRATSPTKASAVSPGQQFVPCEDQAHLGQGQTELPFSPKKINYDNNVADVFATPPKTPASPAVSKLTGRVYGQGVQSRGAVFAGKQAQFVVELQGGGNDYGELELSVRDKKGRRIQSEATFDAQSRCYTCFYTSEFDGPHEVHVRLNSAHVTGSPFEVEVGKPVVDVSKIKCAGPGLEPGVVQLQNTWFDVNFNGTSRGDIKVVVLCPDESKTIEPTMVPTADGYRCSYTPEFDGLHSINVFCGNKPVAGSPFGVRVKPASDPGRVSVWGRGVQPKGVRVNDQTCVIHVTTRDAGIGELDLKINTADGIPVSVKSVQHDEHSYTYSYVPTRQCLHRVNVTFGGAHVADSPYDVNVAETTRCPIRAYGPGLEGGIAQLPAEFTVETNGETEKIEFLINGPSTAEISPSSNNDGTADVTYVAKQDGIYAIHMLIDDEDIYNSPFVVNIQPFTGKVRCTGDGVDVAKRMKRGQTTSFTIDTSQAGLGTLKVEGFDVDYDNIDFIVHETAENVYQVSYTPTKCCRHNVIVSYEGVNVSGSPFKMQCEEPIDPSKVRVFGAAIEGDAYSRSRTELTIDCSQAGEASLSVALSDQAGYNVDDVQVSDNHDGTYTLAFTPNAPDNYKLDIEYAGEQVPRSPFTFKVKPHLDVSTVTLQDVHQTAYVRSLSSFTVDSRTLSQTGGYDRLTATVDGPNTQYKDVRKCDVVDNGNGTYAVKFVPQEEGTHHVHVYYESVELPESPIPIYVKSGGDATRAKAYGPGLERALVNVPAEFTVDTRSAGQGGLSISIAGPCKANPECIDQDDGTCLIKYRAVQPGDYDAAITFGGQPIPGSPFPIAVSLPVDVTQVAASGSGLEASNVRAGVPSSFHVDASESGPAELKVRVTDDNDREVCQAEVTRLPENRFKIDFTPVTEGEYINVHITYGGKPIPKRFEFYIKFGACMIFPDVGAI